MNCETMFGASQLRIGLLVLVLGGFFASCNSSDDSTTQWHEKNNAIYEEIKANTDWLPLIDKNDTNGWPQGVYYQDLSEPCVEKGSEHPLQTAKVRVNYRGYYLNDPDNVFDNGGEKEFLVNGGGVIVRGFSVALQQMVTGDKWKICIPYYLGNGVTSTYSIQAYSTLFFEVELIKIIEQHPK